MSTNRSIFAFETARPANPIFCHQEFLEKLEDLRNDPMGKRASLLMQRLAVDERRQHFKATAGANRGWRRSRLGGNKGSHFYAWWAPKMAPPLKGAEGFEGAPEGAIVLRAIRHHDDHSPLLAQSFDQNYLPVTVHDLRENEFGPEPWTPPQVKFATGRALVRTLKGHPGSGKTTALLNAADQTNAERVLYVTFSRDLAVLAREYFDRYCSRDRRFHVVTFDTLLRELLDDDSPRVPDQESIRRFSADLGSYARHVAPWTDALPALWDEFHAHLIGAALPEQVGQRFEASAKPRRADRPYRQARSRFIGADATAALVDVAARLERNGAPLADRYFPELALAWRAAEVVRNLDKLPAAYRQIGCIAIDECQDLTPLEAYVLARLAQTLFVKERHPVALLAAGDEAQTVRATDFEWGWMNDILHSILGVHSEYRLNTNLRSPRRIASLVNRVWDLYDALDKRDRPGGTGYATIDDDAADEVLYCTSARDADLDALLADLASREGLAIIAMGDTIPHFVPDALRGSVLTAAEVKGLDFHSVCVLNAGDLLQEIISENQYRDPTTVDQLRKRLAIDRMRVALSRPTERLIWLDVNPSEGTVMASGRFLVDDYVGTTPCSPGALSRILAEEQLDVVERIQRCLADARQLVTVKPDLAWSRARHAVLLATGPDVDEQMRSATRLSAAEVLFALAFRGSALSDHLGRPDLFLHAANEAELAGRPGLCAIIHGITRLMRSSSSDRVQDIVALGMQLTQHSDDVEPWLVTAVGERAAAWVRELESGTTVKIADLGLLIRAVSAYCKAFQLPDGESRQQRLRQRYIAALLRERHFAPALGLLKDMPQRDPKAEVLCHEGLGDYAAAAALHQEMGDIASAIRCLRTIPDFEASYKLMKESGDHPALESYEWLRKLNAVIAEKPAKFNRTMLASEKKLLEKTLSDALGVVRKTAVKKATKKVAAKRAAPRKKAAEAR